MEFNLENEFEVIEIGLWLLKRRDLNSQFKFLIINKIRPIFELNIIITH